MIQTMATACRGASRRPRTTIEEANHLYGTRKEDRNENGSDINQFPVPPKAVYRGPEN